MTKFSAVWLWETPASGWRSLWESSSFVPWFLRSVFRDVSGAIPEWPWISGFRRKSSRRDAAFRPTELLGQILCYSTLNFFGNFSDIVFLWSENIWVLCQVTPKMFLTILLVNCCKFSLIPQSCDFLREKWRSVIFAWLSFYWRKINLFFNSFQ